MGVGGAEVAIFAVPDGGLGGAFGALGAVPEGGRVRAVYTLLVYVIVISFVLAGFAL